MATEPKTKGAGPLDVLYSDEPLVLARADSLQALQALCHAEDDTVPTVMTARYRLRRGPVLENLFGAFEADLLALPAGGSLYGDLLPVYEPSSLWSTLLTTEPWRVALPTHLRLILFCEIEQTDYASDLLRDLPRNVTVVVSQPFRGLHDTPEVEAPEGGDAGHDEVFTFVESALSGDQPADVDRLGVAPLADGLARLLMLPQTRPLTVGVQAPWGWGKSSFVGFVRGALIRRAPSNAGTAEADELEAIEAILADAERSEEPDAAIAAERNAQGMRRQELLRLLEERAHRDVISVSFNAWRYEGSEQVWAGLARAITAALEGTLSPWDRLRSRIVYSYERRRLQFWLGFVAPVSLAVFVAVLAILLGVADAGDELSGWSGALAGVLAPVAAVVLIAWRFLHVIQPVSTQVAGYVQGPDHAAHMGYQNEVIDDLKFLVSRVDGEPRVVVFVDDLDRCSDESIMETLQAINLVLGASDFFVVLAIDPSMIHRAIARQRGISDDDDAAEAFAQNYLRKIIQLPLHLPRKDAGQRFGFVSQLFSPAAQREFLAGQEAAEPEAAEPEPAAAAGPAPLTFDPAAIVPPRTQLLREVEDTKDELEALHEFQDFLDENPRELKRLVNVHRLVKILLLRPDAPPTRDDQRKLVAWLVYCACSPGFVDVALKTATSHPLHDEVAKLGDYRFSARDLAPGGTLARAAGISLLISDSEETAAATRPPPAAASDPAVPRAASLS